ncbi:MAG: thioredoxin domain-containing protein [Terriglobales bacterium]
MTFTNRTGFAALTLLALFLANSLIAQSQTKPTQHSEQKPAAKASVASTTPAPATVLPSEDTVNSFLFQTFGYDATISWKVGDIRPSEIPGLAAVDIVITTPQGSNANRLLVSSDGKHAITGEVLPFGAKPYEEAREKLAKGQLNGPAKGPVNAPVTIVEFSDMQCPHCQKAAPEIDSLLAQEPDVRFIFQNFPLPMHNWAEKGAAYVDCVGRASNEAVWKFIDKAFEDQNNITQANADEKLKAIATAAGVNGDEMAACAAKPETQSRVEASVALGKSVGVTGTPTLFINGRSVGATAPLETLKKIVDFAISQEKGTPEKREN